MTPAPPGYELVGELGQGSMGTVYLARQVPEGREVAIKRIVGGASSQDPDTVRRFAREGRLVAQLDHPGIVRVHELVRLGSDLFLVMDLVPGTDLRRVLAAGPPTPEEAVRYVEEIAAALDHASQRGVIHGDLKPSNVLVLADGSARVGDFGLTRLLERQARFATGRGAFGRTPAYMAPELARGDLAVDCRADVYGLGVIAYQMLVGRVPFSVDPDDAYATVRAQIERPPPSPSTLVPGFPPLQEAALLWALQKQPERRPATAGELATALREALERSPTVGAFREDGGRRRQVRAIAGRQAETERPELPTATRPPESRRRRSVLALGSLAAACLAAGALLALGADHALRPEASGTAAALQVTSVTAAVDAAPHSGSCAHATLRYTATVATDGGGGTLAYQWLRPDGATSRTGRMTVPAGRRRSTVTLLYEYDGSGPGPGVAALHVTSPASVYSPPVTYAC